jgi:hypothetical protein
MARVGFEPTSRAHEAREDSRSSTALGLAGRSRTCDLRCPRPAGWPSSPTTRCETPGGTRTRSFRIESPASSSVRPRGQGRLRQQGSNLRFTVNSRASCRSTTPERNGGSRIRTCGCVPHTHQRASNAPPSTPRPCLQQAEGEGVEPPRPRSPPVFETGYRAGGSPSDDSGRIRTCTAPIKSRRLFQLSYRARRDRQGSNLRRLAFQASALPLSYGHMQRRSWSRTSSLLRIRQALSR